MKSFVAVLNKDNKFEHFEVPEEVSMYIKQLEFCVKYPNESKLKEVYKSRFANTVAYDKLLTADEHYELGYDMLYFPE